MTHPITSTDPVAQARAKIREITRGEFDAARVDALPIDVRSIAGGVLAWGKAGLPPVVR